MLKDRVQWRDTYYFYMLQHQLNMQLDDTEIALGCSKKVVHASLKHVRILKYTKTLTESQNAPDLQGLALFYLSRRLHTGM